VSKRDDLFAAVYAEPDSDEPRVVLADYLMEQGDPRGEFIAKQLAGDDAGAEMLLAVHGRVWLDSLQPFTSRAQYRRGFPARLELGAITPGAIDVDGLAADPALATIEDLLIGQAHHGVYGRLIASPAMIALRRIEITHPDVLIALRESPAKIEHVGQMTRAGSGDHAAAMTDTMAACARRAEITSLAFTHGSLPDLFQSAMFPQLTTIQMADGLSTQVTLELVWQRHKRVTVSRSCGLEPCFAGPDTALGAIELERDGDLIMVRAWGEWAYRVPHLFLFLESDDRLRFVLHGRYPGADRFERAARQFDVELVRVAERPRHGYVDVGGPG
jgi:uncharacterized protein (TIGR02996 family)